MRRRFIAFAACFVFIFSFTACTREEDSVRENNAHTQEYLYDNSTPLSNLLSKLYQLEELQDFFGDTSPNERLMYEAKSATEQISFDSVNEKFPVECIRRNGSIVLYSVYKVEPEGRFYVFWSSPLAHHAAQEEEPKMDNAKVLFTTYISELNRSSDFDSIVAGISTAEDIAKIAQTLEFNPNVDSGPVSFCLLEDGNILEVQYAHNKSATSRKDLIVKDLQIVSRELAQTESYLSYIYPEDLP